ncbi:hypothetical protein GH714_038234 [Hevea brasiliensis]|uniref:Uncharacterized protein n=1 Tax=Hevea brasiliensis TaxID=3981 RepID=A0A6A6KE31_HEVBR|nr:hypothetical protein GH714_038234 [Hevea brasiliensis]
MEKILRATFYKKIYPQNPSSTSSTKKYLENKHKPRPVSEDGINHKDDKGSKWVKTDSECVDALPLISAQHMLLGCFTDGPVNLSLKFARLLILLPCILTWIREQRDEMLMTGKP